MFKRRKLAVALACICSAGTLTWHAPACHAQAATGDKPANDLIDRVSVTGTHIPSIDGQTGLPVQVISREQIERANLQTAAQLVNTISATTSFSGFNENQALGTTAQPGFAGGALRGLGFQQTLVLLNGRRLANFAFAGIGVDLNAIPLSAVERVEVLKDGASAIYGSDATAGVINFILRKNYQGAEAYAQYTTPEHTGGYSKHFTLVAGYGDPVSQRFNAYATVDYQKYGGIQARDRSFAAHSYIPAEFVDHTGNTSIPANIETPAGLRNPTGNPAGGYTNPTCAPPLFFPTAGSPNFCHSDTGQMTSIVPENERTNLVGALTWQIDSDNQLFVNGTYSRNTFEFVSTPTPVSNQNTFRGARFLLPATSAFYPHDFARSFGIDGRPLNLYWRALELGPRSIEPTTEQWNVVAGMKGALRNWDYEGALIYNENSDQNRYVGYLRESVILPILNSGVVNPFGANTQPIIDLMSTARIDQTLRTGKSSIASLDFHASSELFQLPGGGPLAFAAGFDARKERVSWTSDPILESGDVLTGTNQPSLSGARNVWAVYAEANAALRNGFEVDVAVRYDHYSDFGSTTNPKVSLRWLPAPTLLLRGSVGNGFLAPSIPTLFQGQSSSFTGLLDDPARCPVTNSAQDCGRAFRTLGGGNPDLKPITSTQWSVGAVWAPLPGLSLGVDYIAILQHDRIGGFSPAQILSNCANGIDGPTCFLVHRGPVEPDYPGLPGQIIQIDQFATNFGNGKVSAVDFSASYKSPVQDWGQFSLTFNGTYNIQYLLQNINGSYQNLVNHYLIGGFPGLIPYWRHYLELAWNRGSWSAALTQNFQTGGYDQCPGAGATLCGGPSPGSQSRTIGNYDILNIGASYTGWQNWTVSAGVKNLMDRNPPFSNQTQSTIQTGYDPSSTDPHGRLYWFGLKYAFR